MSNEAITWAFKQKLQMTDKFILVALADYADEEYTCFPSHKKTADRVGASVATVKRAVARLTDAGYLSVIRRHRPDGSLTSNRYRVNVDRIDPPAQRDPRVTVTPPRVTNDPTPAHSYDPTPAHSYDPTEPSDNHQGTTTEPGGSADADADVVDAELVDEDTPTAKPWDAVAKKAYDSTSGALNYNGMRTIAKWAIEKKGVEPYQVECAMAGLWSNGRAVTKQTVGQFLDGHVSTTRGPQTAVERRQARNRQAADQWVDRHTRRPSFLEIGAGDE